MAVHHVLKQLWVWLKAEVRVNSSPKVSVILATYNQARFLAKAMRSLLAQSYDDFELILVDDCSRDDTADLAEQLALGTRARAIRHNSNLGQYQTYNQTLSLATGEYVIFASGDDVNSPDLLAREVAVLDRQSSVGLVFSNVLLIDEKDFVLRDLAAFQAASMPWLREDYVHSGLEELPRLLNENYVVCIGSVLIRKSALLEIGGWDETMPQAADWDLWLRFASRYDLAYVAEPLLAWRQHADTVTSRLRRSGRYYDDNIRVLAKAFAALPESARHLEARKPELLARAYAASAIAAVAAGRMAEARERLAAAADADAGLLAQPELVVELLCRHGASLLDPQGSTEQMTHYVDSVVGAFPTPPAWWGEWRTQSHARMLWAVAKQARGLGQMAAVRRHAARAALLSPRCVAAREALSLAPAFVPFGPQAIAAYRRARPRRATGSLASALLG